MAVAGAVAGAVQELWQGLCKGLCRGCGRSGVRVQVNFRDFGFGYPGALHDSPRQGNGLRWESAAYHVPLSNTRPRRTGHSVGTSCIPGLTQWGPAASDHIWPGTRGAGARAGAATGSQEHLVGQWGVAPHRPVPHGHLRAHMGMVHRGSGECVSYGMPG